MGFEAHQRGSEREIASPMAYLDFIPTCTFGSGRQEEAGRRSRR